MEQMSPILVWIDHLPFRIYALCCAVLGIKMLASAVYTAMIRRRAGSNIGPENATVFGSHSASVQVDAAPTVDRAIRVQRNDTETIPLFFAVGLLYVFTGASAWGVGLLCGGFTIVRIAHTIAYIMDLRTARAVSFAAGALCTLLMILRIVGNVF
jgi:uncharacterized MAPEG superfamily protein